MSDLISRQDAIDAVRNAEVLISYDAEWSADVLVESVIEQTRDCGRRAIELLPSPEPKTGEWTNAGVLTVHCSNCKSEFHELEAMNFCPNCGADMRGGDDDADE